MRNDISAFSDWVSSVRIAQMEVIPGAIEQNLERALHWIHEAKEAGAELLVFPELCLTGYLIGDLWEEESFLADATWAGEQILAASQGVIVVFGNVAIDKENIGEDGRVRLYNAAFIAQNGSWMENQAIGFPFFPKTLLPNYREFDESRHFYDLRKLSLERHVPLTALLAPISVLIHKQEHRIALILCEDGWGDDYGISLVEHMSKRGAELVLELSASPYTREKNQKRERVFSAMAQQFQIGIAYANCIGMQNNGKTLFGFDGCSTIYAPSGAVVARAPLWQEHLLEFDQIIVFPNEFPLESLTPWAGKAALLPADVLSLENILKRYLQMYNIQNVVIGVSGGIDSAVSAALFVHLLGQRHVYLVSMPSQYNTKTTRSLGAELASELGCWFTEVPISDSVDVTFRQIDGLFFQTKGAQTQIHLTDFYLENIQARDRSGRILSAIAATVGGVFPSNANKAETMVGYATLYGDHGGFLAPLADLWKADIYALGRYLNESIFKRNVIPEGIFQIKPTAELSSKQNPEQGGGDPILYAYHDRLFAIWQQSWRRLGPEEVLDWYLQGTLEMKLALDKPISYWFETPEDFIQDLEKWWQLYKGMGVVKRIQAPPIVALTRRAFGFDYRESLLLPRFSRRYKILRTQLPANHPQAHRTRQY